MSVDSFELFEILVTIAVENDVSEKKDPKLASIFGLLLNVSDQYKNSEAMESEDDILDLLMKTANEQEMETIVECLNDLKLWDPEMLKRKKE